MARSSTDYGNSWNPENVVTSSVALVDQNHLLHNNTEATSVMMARYNSAAHAINITWHSWRTTAFQNTMIMFASKTATTNWAVQAVQDVDQTNDQFQPALDFDTAGNVLIAYYTRREDQNNNTYRPYNVLLSSSGTGLRWENRTSGHASS